MKRVFRFLRTSFYRVFGKTINRISVRKYMQLYVNHLCKLGIIIDGEPNYISPDTYFDSHKYSNITLGNGIVISREVLLLTHDYSIARGIESINGKTWSYETGGVPHFVGEIRIGRNSFIGAKAILLPNTYIGENCIIGAGAVVKGLVPDNSIVIGNPAKIIAKTDEWARKHIEKQDYVV